MTSQEMDRNFPKVMPVNEDYGEEDMPIEEELGDPVPRLTRSATRSTRARTGQADGGGRSDQRGRAHIVTGAGSTCNVQESERRGAAPVGRCLVGQPRCKGIERGCADEAAEGARPRPSRTEATAYRTEATAYRTKATACWTTATADSGGRRSSVPTDVYISSAIARQGKDPLSNFVDS